MSRTVLVVDDDVDCLAQTKLVLETAGYDVVTAESLRQAEELLARLRPAAAVVDLMLEDADGGFRLCHRIKRLDPTIPVLIVTGVASETGMDFGAATEDERMWVKADALLAKPVRAEQLQREVDRLLALRDAAALDSAASTHAG